jgi:hypothetical protein
MIAGVVAVIATLLMAATAGAQLVQAEQKQDLALLYAGHPGSEREKDFLQFLRAHFRQVDTTDLGNFDAVLAMKADVVLLDYDGDGFKAPHPALPQGYSRPTVTIGVAGAMICSQLGLKSGYM